MALFKCKMCGGSLETNSSTAVCEYCGTKQTVPISDDEKQMQLFDRANSYRTNCEFDKASMLYEEILVSSPDNAEAHWGLCLCKYGIEYVEDRMRGKRTPTCHRTQFKSILESSHYLAAIKNSDAQAREVYTAEAEYIDTVQRKILAISAKEEPFDIFICYKETDQNDDRTIDSVIAQEIYNDLTEMGYKVFFSRITLEDKLGIAYEPYIFAALNSAPLMLVVGTKPEYFNAVWVKNEWSRYLHMIEKGQKKTVVPCYRDMSASEMPPEFAILQSQDVSKVGWKQDLFRGIGKILPLNKENDLNKKEIQSDISGVKNNAIYNAPKKKVWIYVLLAIFLGYFGAHSFYAGKQIKGWLAISLMPVFLVSAVADIMVLGLPVFLWILIWPWVDVVNALSNRAVPLPLKYKKKKSAR